MYAIQGEFRRFCFDRAVLTFGSALEAELDSVEGKNEKTRNAKRSRVLDKWLDRPLKFRNPTATKAVSGPDPVAPQADIEQEYTMRGDGSGQVRT